MYLRDTLRLPAKGLSPSALPIFHQPAKATFTDIATGRRDDRAQYRAMLAYIVEHGIGNVVVLYLDRFGRNPSE